MPLHVTCQSLSRYRLWSCSPPEPCFHTTVILLQICSLPKYLCAWCAETLKIFGLAVTDDLWVVVCALTYPILQIYILPFMVWNEWGGALPFPSEHAQTIRPFSGSNTSSALKMFLMIALQRCRISVCVNDQPAFSWEPSGHSRIVFPSPQKWSKVILVVLGRNGRWQDGQISCLT